MNTNIKDLQIKGFVTFPYPADLHAAVKKAAKSWEKFCDLAPEVKTNLPYSNKADGVGYELKDGTGNKGDQKENFDVTLAGKAWLDANAHAINNPTAVQFIEDATALIGLLKPSILDFARQVEEEFGIEGFFEEVSAGEDAFFIRFIHYPGGREVGEETASAHADQSGFTPHLFESDKGLQCMTYEGEWIEMPVGEDGMVIIPAMQLQLRSRGILRALWHRVKATVTTAKTGRYSGVCFVQLKKTPKYDKEKWGRIQEMIEGFNYPLFVEEFSQFFKK
jgi:isopenicillin N synthase-like dioxygenase